MRKPEDILKDIQTTKVLISQTDENDVFNLTRYEERLEGYEKEYENAIRPPRVIKEVKGETGKYKYTRKKRGIHETMFEI